MKVLFLFIIIQYPKILSKIFDSFKYGKLYDDGQLIKIKDYYNLSISISTSKNIYIGFPPSLYSVANGGISNASNALTLNENFTLITCLSNFYLGRLNINTGEITKLSIMRGNYKYKISCPISIYNNTIYIITNSNSGDKVIFSSYKFSGGVEYV